MKEIQLSCGTLTLQGSGVTFSSLNNEYMVFARLAKISNDISRVAEHVFIYLKLEGDDIYCSCIIDITPDDFHTLAKHLPADCINDQLNLLKKTTNEDQKKGASDTRDQPVPEAVTLNDTITLTPVIGE
jgi:hypothetical protein